MQVQFKLTVGEHEFTLVDSVESHSDFFKKMSFYSTLPKVGPNGETDLVIQHRVSQGKYDYFSIVSKKADQEFKFGQSKTQGQLFAKGWEPLYKGESSEEVSESKTQSMNTSVGLGGTQTVTKTTQGLGTPTTAKAAPTPTPTPAQAAPQVQKQANAILSKFGI